MRAADSAACKTTPSGLKPNMARQPCDLASSLKQVGGCVTGPSVIRASDPSLRERDGQFDAVTHLELLEHDAERVPHGVRTDGKRTCNLAVGQTF